MGKLGFACMKGGQRNIRGFVACFGHFQALRAPQGPPRFPYGQPSVAYKVKIEYFTKG